MIDLIDREALKAAYLAEHKGELGGAWKLICEAPTVWQFAKRRLFQAMAELNSVKEHLFDAIDEYTLHGKHTDYEKMVFNNSISDIQTVSFVVGFLEDVCKEEEDNGSQNH